MTDFIDPFANLPKAKLMLLGVFHFTGCDLDHHQPQHGFNVFTEQRQQEVADIIDQLAAFQPTKIAIERTQHIQPQCDIEYQAYERGEFELPADEIYQLGFRLAKRLGHMRVHCVNAWDRYNDDRILVIIGGGHVPILRHCTQASPEYELVEVHEYLQAR